VVRTPGFHPGNESSILSRPILYKNKLGDKVARAKHRWRRERDQLNSFINKIERQRKHQEILEEHRNIKKSGLRSVPESQKEETP
jgi:hypothetical protein